MNNIVKVAIIALATAVAVFFGASLLVGDNQSGVLGSGSRFPHGLSADSTAPSTGEVRGTTFTSTGLATLASASITSTLNVLGILDTEGGFVEGGQLTISTTSATYTLTQAEMQDVKVISIAANDSPAQTFTLPATSTLTTMIPNAGDTQEWIIDNLYTAAATTTTFAAGTGIDIDGTTANDDVINGGVSGVLKCWRLVSTDVRCIVEEMVDAG